MLKAPKTQKTSQDVESEFAKFGGSCMQGWRWYMEDASTVIPDLDGKGTSFVGVYDGHVAAAASQFLAEHMHPKVLKGMEAGDDLNAVLHRAFLEVDAEYLATRRNPDLAGGSTATVVVLGGKTKTLTVANVGDCRCVLSRGGVAEDLTRDHKPELPDERQRIEAAGGTVGEYGRLKNLNISRGIGDFNLKVPKELPPEKQQLTAAPEIKQVQLCEGDDFLVVASDGIWETRSSQEVVDFFKERLGNQEEPLSAMCELLMDSCMKKQNPKSLEEPGTSDNITAVIVVFK